MGNVIGNCLDFFIGRVDIPQQIEIKRKFPNSNIYDVSIYYSNGKVVDKQLTKIDILINYRELLSDYWEERLNS